MDRSNICYLISETRSQDEYGVQTVTETERMVFCNVRSVSQREFFEGGRLGLNPEYEITMFSYDYAGEQLVKLNGVVYTVYRTYLKDTDEIELYIQRKQGNV